MFQNEEIVITTLFSDKVTMRADKDGDTSFVSLRTERGPAWLGLADIQALIDTLERMKQDILKQDAAHKGEVDGRS